MATAVLPFRGETSAVIPDPILNRQPTAATRLVPEVPTKLDEIISKALEKDRDMRCQTAAELRADLKRLKRSIDSSRTSVVTEEARSSSSTSAAVSAPVPVQRKKFPAAIIFAIGLLLAARARLYAGKRFFADVPPQPPLYPQPTVP